MIVIISEDEWWSLSVICEANGLPLCKLGGLLQFKSLIWVLVERIGIEPMTPCLQSRCSPSWANAPFDFAPQIQMAAGYCKAMSERPINSKQTHGNWSEWPWLSVKICDFNLSPIQFVKLNVVGRGGLEPPTSRLSGVRSNQAELPTLTDQ